MKVLILHQHFKVPRSGGAVRSYYLAKALVAAGHDVVVITAHNYAYRQENIEGIQVHWLPVAYDNHFGAMARIISFFRFNRAALRRMRPLADADLCYAISVPLTIGLAAMRIKRRYGIPFLFEVGDLWPEAPIEMGVIRSRILQRMLFRLERRIYAQARGVVALSPAIRDVVAQKGADPVYLIPNMADTAFYRPMQKDPVLEKQFNVTRQFVVSYIGALGAANGLMYFLACAAAARQAGLPIRFLLCGAGAVQASLMQAMQAQCLDNVSLMPFQNRAGVRDVMNVTDAAFVCYKPLPVLETGSPNKYFDGLAAGKLVIVNFSGWIREEIERAGCGVYVDPLNPDHFVRQLQPFLQDQHKLAQYQQAARALAEKKYAREDLSKKFAQVVTGSVQ